METETMKVPAQRREPGSKGVARRLRVSGRIPAVVYQGGAEAQAVSIDVKELEPALRTDFGYNNVFDLDVEGTTHSVMVKEYQFDSLRRVMTHVDFYGVDPEQTITVKVPVRSVGRSEGEKIGGQLQIVAREVSITCKVKDIPAAVEYDISAMQILDTVYIDEMAAPEGCSFSFKNRFPVLLIAKKRGAKLSQDEEGEEAEAEA